MTNDEMREEEEYMNVIDRLDEATMENCKSGKYCKTCEYRKHCEWLHIEGFCKEEYREAIKNFNENMGVD